MKILEILGIFCAINIIAYIVFEIKEILEYLEFIDSRIDLILDEIDKLGDKE